MSTPIAAVSNPPPSRWTEEMLRRLDHWDCDSLAMRPSEQIALSREGAQYVTQREIERITAQNTPEPPRQWLSLSEAYSSMAIMDAVTYRTPAAGELAQVETPPLDFDTIMRELYEIRSRRQQELHEALLNPAPIRVTGRRGRSAIRMAPWPQPTITVNADGIPSDPTL